MASSNQDSLLKWVFVSLVLKRDPHIRRRHLDLRELHSGLVVEVTELSWESQTVFTRSLIQPTKDLFITTRRFPTETKLSKFEDA